MAKKGLLKKIFGGKSKQPKTKDANPTAAAAAAGGGVVAVGVSPKVSPSESAAAEPTVIALQSPPGAGEHVHGSDSVTLDTESENSGSLRACKMEAREEAPVTPSTAGETPQANSFEEAPAGKGEAPSAPVLESDEDAPPAGDDTPTATEVDAEEAADTGDDGDSDLSKAPAKEEEKEEEVKKAEKEEEVKKEVKKKTWAEERVSQMYSSSASKPIQKTKVEIGHDLNAERRKLFEGLSSSHEKAVPHVPDDVKKLGKLSDRMKAFQEKGGDPGPPKESPASTPNREKAAAKRKAVEEMLKRQTDPTAFLETRGKESVGTPSPGRASAKKKQVEEMLKKQLDPKAFIDETKGHVSPESTPGKGELANKKKWVLETLEKQNDPKSFLDKQKVIKHTVDSTHENFGEKKDFEEHRKSFEGKAEDADANVEESQEAVEGTEEAVEETKEVVEGTEEADDPANDGKSAPVDSAASDPVHTADIDEAVEFNTVEPEETVPTDSGASDPVQTDVKTNETEKMAPDTKQDTSDPVTTTVDESGEGDEKPQENEKVEVETEEVAPGTETEAPVNTSEDGEEAEDAEKTEPVTNEGTPNSVDVVVIESVETPQELEANENGVESTKDLHACDAGDETSGLAEQATPDNTQAPHIECTMPY